MNKSKKIINSSKDIAVDNDDNNDQTKALNRAKIKILYQKNEMEKRAAELIIANIELVHQQNEKAKRSSELIIANLELSYQNEQKQQRADELIIANKELVFQNKEKEKRAAEMIVANKELVFQNEEKEKRAVELDIANNELAYQNKEKEKRAAELSVAIIELLYQNVEKEKREAELRVANVELLYQNSEKGKRAAELGIANIELKYQTEEKHERAKELVIANKELAYQNKEKEKRAVALVAANLELQYQNGEKEKRASELVISNKELKQAKEELQKLNAELEQKVIARTSQLEAVVKDLEQFSSLASHDLQEPLRMVRKFLQLLEKKLGNSLDDNCKKYFHFAVDGADRMKKLIEDLLKYSSVGNRRQDLAMIDLDKSVQYVKRVLNAQIEECGALLVVKPLPVVMVNQTLISQVFINLIGNALKYCGDKKTEIEVGVKEEVGKWIFYVKDNGIGIKTEDFDNIFLIFQRINSPKEYAGSGIGLATCKKVMDVHNGEIWAESEYGVGSTFYFTIPK